MRVEEDRKMTDTRDIEELNKEIEDLRKDMAQMRSVPVDDPELLTKYEAMKAKIDAFIEKYKDSELIEVDYSAYLPNTLVTNRVKLGVETSFDEVWEYVNPKF